jgi:hypothetical protein
MLREFFFATCAPIVLAATALVSHPSREGPPRMMMQRCDSVSWSAPTPLIVGDRGRHVVRFPLIASSRGQAVVMGNDIVSYDGRRIPDEPLRVWTLDGRDLGRPNGKFVFAYPRGILRDSTLFMLWADPSDSSRTSDPYKWPGELSSVWAAQFTFGAGWTTPLRIYEGPIEAGPDRSPSAGATSEKTLVEFGRVRRPDSATLLAFRLDGVEWKPVLIPAGREALYPSVAEVGNTILAVFIDSDAGGGYDSNSIFLVRSVDGGRTWIPRLLLSRSGRRPAFDTQLLVDSQRQVHLVWRRETGAQGALGHMMSPDAGRAWTREDETVIAGPANGARAGIDRCGRVQLFYHDLSRGLDKPRLGHAIWSGGWHPGNSHFVNWRVSDLTLHADAKSDLTLVFLGNRSRASDRAPYRTLVSRTLP